MKYLLIPILALLVGCVPTVQEISAKCSNFRQQGYPSEESCFAYSMAERERAIESIAETGRQSTLATRSFYQPPKQNVTCIDLGGIISCR